MMTPAGAENMIKGMLGKKIADDTKKGIIEASESADDQEAQNNGDSDDG